MVIDRGLEDAANALELLGGNPAEADELRRADLARRIELERADAARKALDSGIKTLQEHKIKAEPYRKAFKAAIKLLTDLQGRA